MANFTTAALPDKIAARIQADEHGCWLWLGGHSQGYAQIWYKNPAEPRRRSYRGHRLTYLLLIGDVGPGLVLDHLCGVRGCINPGHLEPVTIEENSRRAGLAKRRDECSQGHPLAGKNLYVKPDGSRRCRKCHNAEVYARRAADPVGTKQKRRERYLLDKELGRLRPAAGPCSIDGCDKPSYARTWCHMHYTRWYRSKEE